MKCSRCGKREAQSLDRSPIGWCAICESWREQQTKAKPWNVYKFTKPNTTELLGQVVAAYHPFAWKLAAERWPDLAKAAPGYPNARLVLRLADKDPLSVSERNVSK